MKTGGRKLLNNIQVKNIFILFFKKNDRMQNLEFSLYILFRITFVSHLLSLCQKTKISLLENHYASITLIFRKNLKNDERVK